ncbi:hypothetical protein Dimus_013569 [Dionaea muscipula]
MEHHHGTPSATHGRGATPNHRRRRSSLPALPPSPSHCRHRRPPFLEAAATLACRHAAMAIIDDIDGRLGVKTTAKQTVDSPAAMAIVADLRTHRLEGSRPWLKMMMNCKPVAMAVGDLEHGSSMEGDGSGRVLRRWSTVGTTHGRGAAPSHRHRRSSPPVAPPSPSHCRHRRPPFLQAGATLAYRHAAMAIIDDLDGRLGVKTAAEQGVDLLAAMAIAADLRTHRLEGSRPWLKMMMNCKLAAMTVGDLEHGSSMEGEGSGRVR